MPAPMGTRGGVERMIGWGLTLAAAALQLRWVLRAGALWRDEAATVEFATLPTLGEVWRSLAYDNFPPLLLVPLRLWSLLGLADGDPEWRLVGLLIGLGTLVAFWVVARATDVRAPLFALAFVGLNPLAVRTLAAIRPHGLGTLTACLTFAAAYRVASVPTAARAVGLTLAALLAVQALYQNVVFVAAALVGGVAMALPRRDWRAVAMLLAAGAIAAVSLLPHLPHLRAGQEWRVIAEAPVGAAAIAEGAATALRESGVVALVLMGAFVVLLLARAALGLRPKLAPADVARVRFAAGALAVAVLAYPIFLWSSRAPSIQSWYFVILIAFAALCLDAAGGGIPPVLRAVAVGAVVLTGIGPAFDGTAIRQTNVDRLAEYVGAHADRRDVVVVHPWFYGVTWRRHYQGAAPWTTVPPLADLRIHRYDLLKAEMTRPDQRAIMAPVIASLDRALRGGHRVWLVGPLPVPRAGAAAPVLAPAPDPRAGWSSVLYQHVWATQAGAFLQAHARRIAVEEAAASDAPTNPFENVILVAADGWRE